MFCPTQSKSNIQKSRGLKLVRPGKTSKLKYGLGGRNVPPISSHQDNYPNNIK